MEGRLAQWRFFAWLFSREDQELRNECEVVRHLLEEPDYKNKPDTEECHGWLKRANGALDEGHVDYAKAWGSFLQIRHLFCRMLTSHDLDGVVLAIQDDLSYVAADQAKHAAKLKKISDKLKSIDRTINTATDLPALRSELEHLSRLAAKARLGRWYKINLYRDRLRKTGYMMIGALIGLAGLLILYPLLLRNTDPLIVLAVIGFGCLGGFLSALMTSEPLSQGSSEFYIQRGLLWLRPTIGAVAGLVMYFLQKSGLVTIGLKDAVPFTYYVAAFGAGFSERFFVKKLAPLLGTGKSKKEKEDEE